MHCTHRGKGEAILFIHGMPTNRMLWDGIIHQLSGEYRCFAVDLPGMGKTPFIPYSPVYLDSLAEQVEAIRIRYRVKKWHVVGHDAGSAVAVQYASRFSQHTACLALLSPAIFPELKPYFLLDALRRPLLGEVLAPLLHFAFWQIAMRRAIACESKQELLHAFSEPFSGPMGAWELMRLVRWGRPEEMLGGIPERLASLAMPTLLFHGVKDFLPAAFTDRAAALIPHSRVVRLEAGHFIPIDSPGDVSAHLRSFFAVNRTPNNFRIGRSRIRKVQLQPQDVGLQIRITG